MELDDLKSQWKQADNTQKPINQNIMELIHHKSKSPIAALKKSYRTQMIAMAAMPFFILATNLQHIERTLSSALFWFYILFCIGIIVFARLNYGVVKKMEAMDGAVKANLEQQLLLLERRQRQNLIGIRIALLFFIFLTEVLPYFQQFRMLNTWHSLSPFIRYGVYAALFLFQYFISRNVSQRKFGQHIVRLKELVKQLQ